MSTRATEIEAELGTWPGVATDASRFECCEFTLGVRELGRLTGGAELEVPFDESVRDALLESAVDVSPHRVQPNSGWLTYELDGDESVDEALALLRLAYLCQVAVLQRRGTADHELSLIDLERELAALDLPDAVVATVRDRFPIESPESAAEEPATATPDETEPASSDRDPEPSTDDPSERTTDEDREPDEGIPSPT